MVGDSPVYDGNEEVADELVNSSNANNLAADQSNNMMTKDTPEETFVAPSFVHDVIALTDDVGMGSSVQQLCGNQVDLASDHSYSVSTQRPSCSVSDHSYIIAESPRTLKRKSDQIQQQLCVTRKKLKMRSQQTRRWKARVSSLKVTSWTI